MPLILCIDAHQPAVALVREALAEVNVACEIVSVDSAVRGLAYLAKRDGFEQAADPDLVLCDTNLPFLCGLDALRLIRSNHPRMRVAMWSTTARAADRAGADLRGAIAYIVKPVGWDEHLAFARNLATLLGSGDAPVDRTA